MRVVRWPGEQAPLLERSVVTLGVFDGVHRGHSEVIRQVVAAARQRSCPSSVVTFDRHPASVLTGEAQPAITSLQHRIRLVRGMQIDFCVVVDFSAQIANMEAAEFARLVCHDLLGAELLVLGFDWRFGRDRQGDVELCRRLGAELGFEVSIVPPVEVDGQPVSSTAIRKAILNGELEVAEKFLGRPVSLYATVVPGQDRGHQLGYPTANLDPHNETIPPEGVYASWAFTDDRPLPAVTSVGPRATFHHEAHPPTVVETHLIGRREDLHGREIEVQFVSRLRAQRAFASGEELKAQIALDIEGALAVLARACAKRREM